MINPNKIDYITNTTKEDFWECFRTGYDVNTLNMSDYDEEEYQEMIAEVRADFEAWFDRFITNKHSQMVQC